MIIKNLTRKSILSEDAIEAKSIKSKTLGLIFEKGKKSLIIKTRFGIHTHLMSRPIDILILDQNQKVVRMREKLEPSKIFFWNPKFSIVIELPKGIIRKTKTQLGDKLKITK